MCITNNTSGTLRRYEHSLVLTRTCYVHVLLGLIVYYILLKLVKVVAMIISALTYCQCKCSTEAIQLAVCLFSSSLKFAIHMYWLKTIVMWLLLFNDSSRQITDRALTWSNNVSSNSLALILLLFRCVLKSSTRTLHSGLSMAWVGEFAMLTANFRWRYYGLHSTWP